jgi:hypothetical protein
MHSRTRTACLTVLAMGLAAGAAAQTRQVPIYNDSDFAMVQLQAKPRTARIWPYDLLGKYSLGVGRGQNVSVPVNQGCIYDFLATFDNGRKQQKLVDLCKPLRRVSFSGT